MKHADHFTVSEGAKLVGRPAVTVRYWARTKRIGSYKSEGTWLINRHDLEWMARNTKPRKPSGHAAGRRKS